MNYERDAYGINFREIINIWKYIENIQQYGKWTGQSKFTKSAQSFISQFNLDIFKAVQERQWFEAQREATKYFFLVKRLTVKMQSKLGTKELDEELERFKEEAIEILNPANRSQKNLIKFKKLRSMKYAAVRKEIMEKFEEICNLCYKNWDRNQSLIKAQFPCKGPFRYEPIRFSESREISIPRYYSCTMKQKEEALISKEKEKKYRNYTKSS
jgi:hypothetical protein